MSTGVFWQFGAKYNCKPFGIILISPIWAASKGYLLMKARSFLNILGNSGGYQSLIDYLIRSSIIDYDIDSKAA